MQFKIEQIAISPKSPTHAKTLLKELGAEHWISDIVRARGEVFGDPSENIAELQFNYQLAADGSSLEFEILDYQSGDNWVEQSAGKGSVVTHLGMHVKDEAELEEWRDFFAARGIPVAQEVDTQEHRNDFLIETGRKYRYVIFDTREILGVDLKFILRREPGDD